MPKGIYENNGKRGFSAMSLEKQRMIASRGGKAAHEMGRAHKWTSEEAKKAGRIGGKLASRDRAHMIEIGRKGGLTPKRNRADSNKNFL